MSKETKALLIYLGAVTLGSLMEIAHPYLPGVAVAAFITFMLGRWAERNKVGFLETD